MIQVISLKQPERGAIVLLHCMYCGVSEFTVSEHAKKPEHGDYWQMELCPNGLVHFEKFFLTDWPKPVEGEYWP